MDKHKRSRSRDLMPPPPNVPKTSKSSSSQRTTASSKAKSKKPRHDKPIKKNRLTLQEIEKQFLPTVENPEQGREKFADGVTYEDLTKWGELTLANLREFCEKAANKDGKKFVLNKIVKSIIRA